MGIIGSFQGYVDSPLYLYNKGVWSNLQTTGVTATKGTAEEVPTVHFNRIMTEINSIGRLNQTVNLSSYNYLKFYCVFNYVIDNTNCGIGISQNPNITSYGGLSAYVLAGAIDKGTVILNVSSITGNYYLYFFSDIKKQTFVHEIYLTTV